MTGFSKEPVSSFKNLSNLGIHTEEGGKKYNTFSLSFLNLPLRHRREQREETSLIFLTSGNWTLNPCYRNVSNS